MPLKPIGGKRCVLCNRVWAQNKISPAIVEGVPGLWVCKPCEAKVQATGMLRRGT